MLKSKKIVIPFLVGMLIIGGVFVFAQEAEAEEETIEVLMPLGGGPYQKEHLTSLIEVFEENNPEVKVEPTFVAWPQLYQKEVTLIGSGAAPDVMYIPARWTPFFARLGALTPLNDYISQEKYDMYPENTWKALTYKEDILGVPRAISTKMMLYNKDLLEQAGVDELPENWDQLMDAVKKVHNPEEGVYGIGVGAKETVNVSSQFFNYLFANGGKAVDQETGEIKINDKKGIEALKFYRDLTEYAQPSPAQNDRGSLAQLFVDGKLGFTVQHWFRVPEAEEAGVNVGVIPIPKGPSAEQPTSNILVQDGITIPAQADNKELAWKWIEFMTNLENQAKFDAAGFLPLMKEERTMEEFQKFPIPEYLDQLKYARPQPLVEDWKRFMDILLSAISKGVVIGDDVEEVLNTAADQMADIPGLQK